MDLIGHHLLAQTPQIRRKARHLSWFQSVMRDEAETLGQTLGYQFTIDDLALTRSFVAWHRRFEQYRTSLTVKQADFVAFSAGLMLEELVRNDPVKASARLGSEKTTSLSPEVARLVAFWPEGLFYVELCLAIANSVLQQEFGTEISLTPAAQDFRTWTSFRENVRQDPSLAIAFFDLFTGRAPDWSQPAAPHLHQEPPALSGS